MDQERRTDRRTDRPLSPSGDTVSEFGAATPRRINVDGMSEENAPENLKRISAAWHTLEASMLGKIKTTTSGGNT